MIEKKLQKVDRFIRDHGFTFVRYGAYYEIDIPCSDGSVIHEPAVVHIKRGGSLNVSEVKAALGY